MAQYIFTMSGLTKVVPPKKTVLEDINLSFFHGAKIGVLGYNGAGKSTLLRIMAGVDNQYDGEARPQPGINVGYLPQEPQLNPDKDVRGNVEEGVGETKALIDRYNEVSAAFADPDADFEALIAEQGELQQKIDAADGWDLDRKLEVAADALRLPAWDAEVDNLSGGERRRVALARTLLSEPDMLILDEPTNHLDAESVEWLERYLGEFSGTVVAVTHDRYFLDNVAGWILELDRGHGYPFEGNYSAWLEYKEKRLEQEEKEKSARQKAMKEELEWARSNPKGRQSKNKARLKRLDELATPEYQERAQTNEIYIPPGPRLGDKVIEAEDLSKTFRDRELYQGLSFVVPSGGIVGVIGPNGAGKTTLLRLITGEEEPDGGRIELGDTVDLAYVDQSRDALNGDNTVWEEISDGADHIQVGNWVVNSRAYVSRFNFSGSDQQKKVRDLSGGERNRVHLAKLLKRGGNTLLLDEPTNDLDVETLRALEQALHDFPGSAIVVSHDRWFLDRVATHTMAFEDDGQVIFTEGSYSEYETMRAQQTGAGAEQSKTKHKRLDR
ncbi:energy-dependent translational throttle protein EttA [Thiohalorhabdus sp.]|uniref:energy-dependent translational throttle protein EttA n=1 Tax=Thiohalorhabdus sp. TaxID=3094134 RepID=UPI002FC3DB52